MLNQKKNLATGVFFTLVSLTLVVVFILALIVGRYDISIGTFFKMLFSQSGYEMERSIVLNLRLPRTIIAALTGLALSVSGLLYNLENAELTSSFPLGVSNEFVGKKATVSVKNGTLNIVFSGNIDIVL